MGYFKVPKPDLAYLTDFWELRLKPFIGGGESIHRILNKFKSIYLLLSTEGLGIDAAEQGIRDANASWKILEKYTNTGVLKQYQIQFENSLNRMSQLITVLGM